MFLEKRSKNYKVFRGEKETYLNADTTSGVSVLVSDNAVTKLNVTLNDKNKFQVDITNYVSDVPSANTKNALPLEWTLEYDGYELDLNMLNESIDINDSENKNVILVDGKKATRNIKKFFDVNSECDLLIDDVGSLLVEKTKTTQNGATKFDYVAKDLSGHLILIKHYGIKSFQPVYGVSSIEVKVKTTQSLNLAFIYEFKTRILYPDGTSYVTEQRNESGRDSYVVMIDYPNIDVAYEKAFSDVARMLSIQPSVHWTINVRAKALFALNQSGVVFEFDKGVRVTKRDFIIQLLCGLMKGHKAAIKKLATDKGELIKQANLFDLYPSLEPELDTTTYPIAFVVDELDNEPLVEFAKKRKWTKGITGIPPVMGYDDLKWKYAEKIINKRMGGDHKYPHLETLRYNIDTWDKIIYPTRDNGYFFSLQDIQEIKKYFPDYKIGFDFYNPNRGPSIRDRKLWEVSPHKACAIDSFDIATGELFTAMHSTMQGPSMYQYVSPVWGNNTWMEYAFDVLDVKSIMTRVYRNDGSEPHVVMFQNGEYNYSVPNARAVNPRAFKGITKIKKKRYGGTASQSEFITKELVSDVPQKPFETNNANDPAIGRPTTAVATSVRWIDKDIRETSSHITGIENVFCNYAVNGVEVYYFNVDADNVRLHDDIDIQVPPRTKKHFNEKILPEINSYIKRLKKTTLKVYEKDDKGGSKLVKTIPLQYDVGLIRQTLHNLLRGGQVQGNGEVKTTSNFINGQLPLGMFKENFVATNYGVIEAGKSASTIFKKGAVPASIAFQNVASGFAGGIRQNYSAGGSTPTKPMAPNASLKFASTEKDGVRDKLVVTINTKDSNIKVSHVCINGSTIYKHQLQDEYGRDFVTGSPAFKWQGDKITIYYPSDTAELSINGIAQIRLGEKDGTYGAWFANKETTETSTSNYVIATSPKYVVALTPHNFDLRVLKLRAEVLNVHHFVEPGLDTPPYPKDCWMDLITRGNC